MAESKTEKMKKLFADKTLDAEQMEEVAGGTIKETADDSRFLNVLLRGHPLQPDRYGEERLDYDVANKHSRYREIEKAWEACGVDVRIREGGSNNYYSINGETVTREAAMNHAMAVMGRPLAYRDWYWSN